MAAKKRSKATVEVPAKLLRCYRRKDDKLSVALSYLFKQGASNEAICEWLGAYTASLSDLLNVIRMYDKAAEEYSL